MLTHVGGLSIFQQLELDSANEAFHDSSLKDVLWYEELTDCIVTHIGSSSLFLEYVMVTNPELARKVHKGTCLDHVIGGLEFVFSVVPSEEGNHQQLLAREMQHGTDLATVLLWRWDPGDWRSLQFVCYTTGIVLEMNNEDDNRLRGCSPGKCEHLHDLHRKIIGSSINKEILQQLCGIARLWDPGISTAETNVFHPGIWATRGDCLVPNMIFIVVAIYDCGIFILSCTQFIQNLLKNTPLETRQLDSIRLSAEDIHDTLMCLLLATIEGIKAWADQSTKSLNFPGILQVEQAGYSLDQIILGFISAPIRQIKHDITEFFMVGLKITLPSTQR
jgi:hypothetical protein